MHSKHNTHNNKNQARCGIFTGVSLVLEEVELFITDLVLHECSFFWQYLDLNSGL
jgi:hypothetical protein